MKIYIFIYLKLTILLTLSFLFKTSVGQTYTPVTVSGFNMDVVAESTGNSSLFVTSDTMDQSDHVICTQQFAIANSFTTTPFGLPDNGTIISGTRTYQLQPFTNNNVLNIYTSQTDTLFLSTPSSFTNISLAALATENDATINIVFNFSDGTSQTANNVLIPDWCTGNGKATPILQSYGRMRRSAAPLTYSDGTNGEPEIFSFDYTLPCSKTLVSISFKNVSSSALSNVTRAFILAVSGVGTSSIIAPILNKDTLCKPGITTLTVLNPQSGLTYNWYNSSTGGTLLTTGTSYSPIIFATTSYYIQAVNSAGCTSQLIGDTIILGPTPVLPIVKSPVNACSGSVSLSVTNPQLGLSYQWYSSSTGGILLGTGNPLMSPSFIGDTSFYVESVNKGGCESKRTQLKINVLSPIGSINGTNIICQGKQATFYDTSINGIWGVTNNLIASINNSGTISCKSTGKDTTIYTRTTSGGCKDTAFFPFTINPLPVIGSIKGVSNLCVGDKTQLLDSTIGGTWICTNTSVVTIDNIGRIFTNQTGIATIKYIVTNSYGCMDSVSTILYVKAPTNSITNVSICTSDLPFKWNGNSYTLANSYIVHLTNAFGCDSAATLNLNVENLQINISTNPAVSPSSPISNGAQLGVNITPFGDFPNSIWQPSELFANNQTSQTITIPDTTSFWLKVIGISANNCSYTDSVYIDVTRKNIAYIPNALAPAASDINNKSIKVYGASLKSADIMIYNPWGQKIFSTEDAITNSWDGTYNGKAQPSGVYVYVVKLIYKDNKTEIRTGSINLIR